MGDRCYLCPSGRCLVSRHHRWLVIDRLGHRESFPTRDDARYYVRIWREHYSAPHRVVRRG